ncbi:MAG: NUDIX hydrolase [Candidatus Woesearchaeota archaeon]
MELILASALVIKDRSILLLHRTDHDDYETPGGKLRADECTDPHHPTREELLACALRELSEEVECTAEPFGDPIEHHFTVRDGRNAYVVKFPMRYVSGSLTPKEDIFDEARLVPIEELHDLRLSPDLSELLDEIITLVDRTSTRS